MSTRRTLLAAGLAATVALATTASVRRRPRTEAPSQDLRYRQGTVLSFNQATLENTVNVGGTPMMNLPLLGVADAATLTPGAVVGLVAVESSRGSTSYAIVGRYVTPGTAAATDAITRLSQRTYTGYTAALETVTSASFDDLPDGPALDFVVGASGRVLVFPGADIQGVNDGVIMSFELSGANTLAPSSDRSYYLRTTAADVVRGQAASVIGLDGLNPGTTTITAKYAVVSSSASISRRRLTVLAL